MCDRTRVEKDDGLVPSIAEVMIATILVGRVVEMPEQYLISLSYGNTSRSNNSHPISGGWNSQAAGKPTFSSRSVVS